MLEQEIDSLAPSRALSRRGFVQAAVGSGFAAAVLPVTAQAIKTDSEGLTVGEVTIPVGDFKMPAYRAQPAGKTNLPVILVVSEIFGVHEYIADVARRFGLADMPGTPAVLVIRPDGSPVNALRGYLDMTAMLLERFRPTGYAACCEATASSGAASTRFTASGSGRQVMAMMRPTTPRTTMSDRTMSRTVWPSRALGRPVGRTSSLTCSSSGSTSSSSRSCRGSSRRR